MTFKSLIFLTAMIASSFSFVGASGIDSYTLETEYQKGKQVIRVLVPDTYEKGKAYGVLYVLPVRAGEFGGFDPLREMNAHNVYGIIIVGMGFEKEPWFGDHATDRQTRQASYLKECVVPFIEGKYSTLNKPEGRLLLGFSKSGWGAFSLILTYPDYFGYAAAWDAPITFKEFHFRMEDVYGTREQLALYRPDLLIPQRKKFFQDKTRLVLTGSKIWGPQTFETHALLDKEGVKHVFDNTLNSPHSWNRQWMVPTLEALMRLTRHPVDSNPKREPISNGNGPPHGGTTNLFGVRAPARAFSPRLS
jgi:hypothetical protein